MTTGSVPYIYQPREFSAPDHERLTEIVRGELNVIADILNSGEAVFAPEEHGHDWDDLSNVPEFASRWPSWSEVTSKPSTFTPSAHTHPYADIVSVGTNRLLGRHSSGTGAAETIQIGSGLQISGGGTLGVHSVPWSSLTGLPDFATRWPTWSEVTSKPSVFPPDTHSHAISDITGLQTALDGKEPGLGNPAADGYILSSTMAGARSWIAPPSGGGTWGSITGTLGDQTDLATALGLKANDADVVKLTGAQTVGGFKTFTDGLRGGSVEVADAGGTGWVGTYFGSDLALKIGTNGATRLYINHDNGYLGVGIQPPTSMLHVAGDVRWTGDLLQGTVPWARLSDVSAKSPFDAPNLGSGTDLNDLNAANGDAGFYYQPSNASTAGNNYPNANAGSLLVQRAAVSGGFGGTQLYQTYQSSTPELFFRSAYGSWSAWRKVWHDGNFDPASKANDSDVVKLNANNVFTAGATGANGNTFSAGLPGFWLVETDQAADGQQWRVSANGGLFNISTFDDARSTSAQAFAAQRSGNTVTSARIYAAGSIQLTSQNHAASTATTGAQVRHSDGNMYDVGMNVMPPVASNGATRTVLTVGDNGKATIFTGSTSTWTTSTGAASGYVMNGLNAGSGNITLNAGSGQTIYWFTGSGLTTGSRTISPGGVFTLWARTATVLYLWGSGIS